MRAARLALSLMLLGRVGARSAALVARAPVAARRALGTATRSQVSAAAGGSTGGGGRGSAAVVQDDARRSDASPSAPAEKLDLNPPRGTRDFFPADMRLRSWLFGQWRAVSAAHAFEEYDSPVLEAEALYVRKAGEEVTQQLYNFEDKGGRRVSLRPEMTPSLARMVLAQRNALPLPLKWFSIPQCWRYERTTRGRRREHFQWNMDIWGVAGVEAEAELLAAAVGFCERVGLGAGDVGVRVSSRRCLAEAMAALGVPDELFARACIAIDKLDKIGEPAVREQLAELGLQPSACDRLFSVLRVTALSELERELGADSAAVAELRTLFECAEALGIAPWLTLDLSVVRGLAYYTGVVFEGFDRRGELRAIFGGGRYDGLLPALGGPAVEPMPAVGFGFGDAVIVELLKDKGLLPDTESAARADALVFPLGTAVVPAAMRAAAALRAAGRRADLVLDGSKKMKWAFKQAERLGAPVVVVVGEDEAKRGSCSVKNLATGEQKEVPIGALAEAVPSAVADAAA